MNSLVENIGFQTAYFIQEFDKALSALNLITVTFNISFILCGVYSTFTWKSRELQRENSRLVGLLCQVLVATLKLGATLMTTSILHCTVGYI